MKRVPRPKLLRHLGVWLALAGAALVVLAGVAVTDLRERAAERRGAQTAFLHLERDAQRLHQIVLESLARGEASETVFTRVAETGRRIDERLTRDAVARDGTDNPVQQSLAALASYRAVAERLLVAIAAGNRTGGGADQALVPAYRELERRLAAVGAERSRQAAAADDRAVLLSTATVIALFVLLLALLLLQQRVRRRADVAASQSAALTASEARFRAVVDDHSDLVLLVGADGLVRSASRAARDLVGVEPADLTGEPVSELLHPDDVPLLAVSGMVAGPQRLELRMRHTNGYWLSTEAVLNDMTADPHVQALVLTVRDATERKAFEEQLRHRAFHDPLTQLANRALLFDRLQHALTREGRFEDQVAVLFVDLDDFKVVNDTLGHGSGDEILVAVARRLRSSLRSADTAARLGGDEFGLVVEGVTDLDEVVAVARRVIEALTEPFSVGGLPVALSASVGVAVGTLGTVSADELLRNADIAMYAAKREGKSRYVVFRDDLHTELARRFPSTGPHDADRVTWMHRSEEQRNEVRRLLSTEGAIVPVFQPIVALETGEVAGYEALARFPLDPDVRPPNVWFAQAHRCGLGIQLETRAALTALALRGEAPPGYLAINVSPAALRSDDFSAQLPRDLRGVLIEITEHELVADGERLQTTLEDLRTRGARIAVDDAGAGYAGLRQLMLLCPDVIKLDRGLIQDVAHDQAKQALVECFVRFAQRTGADVCAEGIESIEDYLVLAGLGVRYGQGYAIARPAAGWPQPEEELRRAVRETAAQLETGPYAGAGEARP